MEVGFFFRGSVNFPGFFFGQSDVLVMLIYHQFLPCARHQLKLLLQWRSGRFFVWTWRGLSLRKFVFQMFFFFKKQKGYFFFQNHVVKFPISKLFRGLRLLIVVLVQKSHLPGGHGIIIMSQRERDPILRLVCIYFLFGLGPRLSRKAKTEQPAEVRGFCRQKRVASLVDSCGNCGGFLMFFDFWYFFGETLEPFGSQQKHFDDLRRFLFFAWKFKKISFNNMFVIFWWDFFLGKETRLMLQ